VRVKGGGPALCCLCWDRGKPWETKTAGAFSLARLPRFTPHASPATARFARRRRNSGPPPLLPPGCPPAATRAYSMSLRSLSSSPAVWPSCPASARARSPRAGGRVRPVVHGFLRRVKIRPPPSASPPPPFSFLICSLPFLPPPVPIPNPSASHGSHARCICFPLGLTPRAEQ
jgi:hypothetical protein